jgi:hypothetical protein
MLLAQMRKIFLQQYLPIADIRPSWVNRENVRRRVPVKHSPPMKPVAVEKRPTPDVYFLTDLDGS